MERFIRILITAICAGLWFGVAQAAPQESAGENSEASQTQKKVKTDPCAEPRREKKKSKKSSDNSDTVSAPITKPAETTKPQ